MFRYKSVQFNDGDYEELMEEENLFVFRFNNVEEVEDLNTLFEVVCDYEF